MATDAIATTPNSFGDIKRANTAVTIIDIITVEYFPTAVHRIPLVMLLLTEGIPTTFSKILQLNKYE